MTRTVAYWTAGALLAAVCLPGLPAGAADAKAGTKRALIVCGLPGDDEHRTLYAGDVEKIVKALTGSYGFAAPDVFLRFGEAAKDGDGPALKASRGLSDRQGIEADVAELRKRLGPDDTLWVVVLGHGHYDGRHSHLNIPGPDLDERAFGALFAGLKAKEQLFVVTTPASGFFLKPLAAPGRIVVAATEADQEVNETIFPHALADALAAPPSQIDRDKDGAVSVLELYLAVVEDVLKRYADDENLPTEHARLDDSGDGYGTELQEDFLPPETKDSEKKQDAAKKRPPRTLGPKDDGFLAGRTFLGTPPAPKAAADREKDRSEAAR